MRLIISLVFLLFSTLFTYSQTPVEFPLDSEPPNFYNLREGFQITIYGTVIFPNEGYWVHGVYEEVNLEQEIVTIVLQIAKDAVHTYPVKETSHYFIHRFEMPFATTESLKEHVVYRQEFVDVYSNITPLQTNISDSFSVATVPPVVRGGKSFRLSFQGEYPNGGYAVLRKYPYYSDGTFYMNLMIDEPESGDDISTPFEFQQWANGIVPGVYNVVWNINGEMVHETSFQVDEYDPPISDYNDAGAYYDISPISNAFRTFSYGINIPTVQTSDYILDDSFQDGIRYSSINNVYLLTKLPEDHTGRFSKTPSYQNGFSTSHKVQFYRGVLDKQPIYPVRMTIGNIPTHKNLIDELIYYESDGMLKIDSNGNYASMNETKPDHISTGKLSSELFSRIKTMMIDANFIDKDFHFGPVREIGSGFIEFPKDRYVLAYDDVAVNVVGIDYAPADIRKIIETMNAIIQGSIKTSHIDSWELCE